MERLFNQMVHLVARRGFFQGELVVALDGSKLPTPKAMRDVASSNRRAK